MALILFSNIVYILDNYTVSWFQLLSTEVTLVRGIVQVIGFGFVLLNKNRKLSHNDTEGFQTCFAVATYYTSDLLRHESSTAHNCPPVVDDLPLRRADVLSQSGLPGRRPSHAHRGPHRPLLHHTRLRRLLRASHTEETD